MTINEENYRSSVFAFLNGAIELKQLEGGPIDQKDYADMLIQTEQRCDQFYEQAYRAKSRLFQRLHVEEDLGVNSLHDNLMFVATQMAMAMFESGVRYARSFPEGFGLIPPGTE